MNEQIPFLKEKAANLTTQPGVYLMKNSKGAIIYVGKAKNLRNRVRSYFRALDKHTPKVLAMVNAVRNFDVVVTTSEFEALVLECNLIKLHMPRYNILLKDDKGYSYLRIGTGDYPRITECRKPLKDGATYIGPYMSSAIVRDMADNVNKSLGLPTCSKKFPEDFRKSRPCLNFHIGQCLGVCRGNISPQEYESYINRATELLKGKNDEAQKNLRQQMEEASENLEFEKAARLRDRLKAMEKFFDKQRVVYAGAKNQDVIAFIEMGGKVSVAVIKFRDERLVDKREFLFNDSSCEDEIRNEFLQRYYLWDNEEIPPLVVTDSEIKEKELVEKLLSETAKRKVVIFTPQKGDNLKLIEMAKLNAAQCFTSYGNRTDKDVRLADDIKNLLGLKKTPSYIEAYDISNIGSDTIVGGMVVFCNAKPLRAAYKKFIIKDIKSPDDYTAMREMLLRRFSRYLSKEEYDKGFKTLPDLVLIDGGRGHLSVASNVLLSLGLDIPVFGMVKDSRHRTRAITAKDGEISISPVKQVFSFITQIQDEVHRFTVGYARSSHTKTAFQSQLESVPSIGKVRARELFSHFKTKKAIIEASIEELQNVPKMTRTSALALRQAVEEGKIS